MKRALTKWRQMIRRRIRDRLLRALFVLSAFALEGAWIVALAIGGFKFYKWLT